MWTERVEGGGEEEDCCAEKEELESLLWVWLRKVEVLEYKKTKVLARFCRCVSVVLARCRLILT